MSLSRLREAQMSGSYAVSISPQAIRSGLPTGQCVSGRRIGAATTHLMAHQHTELRRQLTSMLNSLTLPVASNMGPPDSHDEPQRRKPPFGSGSSSEPRRG